MAYLTKLYEWLRFGKITEHVKSVDGGVASEIEYRDSKGKPIGYWAYGSFDPAGPYPLKPINTFLLPQIALMVLNIFLSVRALDVGAACGWFVAAYAIWELRQLHIKVKGP